MSGYDGEAPTEDEVISYALDVATPRHSSNYGGLMAWAVVVMVMVVLFVIALAVVVMEMS